MSSKMMRRLSAIVMLMVCMCTFVGCNSQRNKEEKIIKAYGGDIVRYSQCLATDKESYVSFPIILNKKVESVEIEEFFTDNAGSIKVKDADVDVKEYTEYKGYYIYFLLISVECAKNNEPVNTNIEKIIFNIDGQKVEYVIPYYNVKNTYFYCDKYGYSEEENAIFIGGNYAGIYGYAPDENREYDLNISSNKDVVLKSYLLPDFVEIGNLKVNGKVCDSNTLNIEAEAGSNIRFDYKLEFNKNVSVDNIVRTSQIIIYEYEGKDYIWTYESGLYIWKHYMDYGNIKRYIDAL